MNDSKLVKFQSRYCVSKLQQRYDTNEVQTGYGSFINYPIRSYVDITLDNDSLFKLVNDTSEEAENRELREKYPAVQLAYEKYLTLLNLVK